MTDSELELVCAYWTSAGPVEVHFGREWSLYSLEQRCAQAQRVGFAGLGIWHADLEHQLGGGASLQDIRRTFDDHGLRCGELEFLGDWFLDPGTEGRAASDETRRLLWDAAAVLEPDHVKVGNLAGTECPLSQVIERFGELCADAAQHFASPVAYEFMPYDAVVNTVDLAVELVEQVGAANSGLIVDTWHMGKLRAGPEELRKIPLRYLNWIELCDGPFEYAEDRLDEVINRRRLPGDGEFDIPGYIEVARDMGYTEAWGVEVLSEDLRNRPIEEIFERAYEASAAQLAAEPERSVGV